jgi:GWxTD domain-containing protein
MLTPYERGRLDNIQRMLRPMDSTAFAGWTDAQKQTYEAKYWTWSAPLWSHNNANPRTEFLARVIFAELRWTTAELKQRGADSDRGRVYIRYGPPDARSATNDNSMQVVSADVVRERPERDEMGGRIETWWYDYPRLAWHFRGMPTFGTSYFTSPAAAYERMDSIPSRWDNISKERIDSLPVRVARFRAMNDSVDVVFASQPPVADIRAAAAIEGAVRTDFWLLDENLRPWAHDSGTTTVGGTRAFVRRLASGEYMYRFEATAESSLRGARALASMRLGNDPSSDFAMSGFGMSDVLIASRVAPRGAGQRWYDHDYDANAGAIRKGAEVSLLWENYDFGEKNGDMNYQMVFTITRKYERLLDRIRAKITTSFSTMLGNEQTEDRVIYRYERQRAHAPVVADYITLLLTDIPAGEYDLTVELFDRNSQRSTSKTSRIVIRD